MRFVYVVRRDKEWRNFIPNPAFFGPNNGHGQSIPRIIARWNDTFNVNYLEFRRSLNELRLKNLADLEGVEVYDSSDDALNDILKQKNVIILPTDDDDWFHPDLLKQLETTFNDGISSVRWPYTTLYKNKLEIFHKGNWPKNFMLYHTNNYAVKTPCPHYTIVNHVMADGSNLRRSEFFMNALYSVHNKSLASLSSSVEDENYKAFLRHYEICRKGPDEATINKLPIYFHKFINEMTNMYKQLELKENTLP